MARKTKSKLTAKDVTTFSSEVNIAAGNSGTVALVDRPLVTVDFNMGLYELTDLFYSYYRYHNDACMLDYQAVTVTGNGQIGQVNQSISRFQALRRIEACRLGSRPFLGGKGNAVTRPNANLGYFKLAMDYATLPYKAVFSDGDWVRVQINRKLYQDTKLSASRKEVLDLEAANNPNLENNKEISDDVSDALYKVMKTSKRISRCLDCAPLRLVQDGLVAFVHSDLDWQPEPVQALDLVTEPQCNFDPKEWSSFFVIRKMSAQEMVRHIRDNTPFWNTGALRWALSSAGINSNLISPNHYTYNSGVAGNAPDVMAANGENFTVKSFLYDKGARSNYIGAYFGNVYVVEGYYVNTEGRINKVVFFPSSQFLNTAPEVRLRREQYNSGVLPVRNAADLEELKQLEFADVLFYREDVFDRMEQAITVVPSDRSELTLERQRGLGHEIFAPVEMVMRIDSSILNFAILMGIPFYKDQNLGQDAQRMEDMEINLDGEMCDLGTKEFSETPFQADLSGMINVRQLLLAQIANKGFLGGLDNTELQGDGRGAQLAELPLIRDARVHKQNVESFAKGLKEFFTKIFVKVLENKDSPDLVDNRPIKYLFFDQLEKVQGYESSIFDYKEEDVLEDTGLPYWMELEAIRNGGSHFGAAELILYTRIKQVFGDALDQKSLDRLNRMGIKSLLGAQDAQDILGDSDELRVTDQDQFYRAAMENASIIGSVDAGALNYESLPVLADKDNHVLHLRDVHNPKAKEILEKLAAQDVTPQVLADMSERDLETRNSLILKLGALANHMSMHLAQLERYGAKRPDINQLKEETNYLLQATEGLFNSLQINLRVLLQKQQETSLKLQNLSPENQAAMAQAQNERLKIEASIQNSRDKLALANKIADQRQSQHIDKQVSKARDREAQRQMAQEQARLKELEVLVKAAQPKAQSKPK